MASSSLDYPEPERRRGPRYPTANAAEVMIVADRQLQVSGRVLDVSRSGLRLELPLALDQGTRVKITFRRPTVILGEVRHCRRAGKVFHVGIEIHEVPISPNRHVDEDELRIDGT